MSKLLHVLFAAAAVAVLALAGTWFYDRADAKRAAAEAAALRQEQEIAAREAKLAQMKRTCRTPTLAWLNGYRDVAEKAFGKDSAHESVRICLELFPELKD